MEQKNNNSMKETFLRQITNLLTLVIKLKLTTGSSLNEISNIWRLLHISNGGLSKNCAFQYKCLESLNNWNNKNKKQINTLFRLK